LGGEYTALHYADWIKPGTAQTKARYAEPHLKDFAAVTRNEFEQGIGWYIGTIAKDDAFYDKLIAALLQDSKLRPIVKPPAGIEIAVRAADDRGLLFVINHTDGEITVPLPGGRLELLSNQQTKDTFILQPFGVAVVQLNGTDLRGGSR
jgi:beta-galactosidase